MAKIGVVAIGRNEGERLRRCLDSVTPKTDKVVYVDSGSTDGSVDLAKAKNVEVVALDLSVPFTAARARNQGFARLMEVDPQIEYVQFVDGDCEVVSGWITRAEGELDARPDVAIVCGRRRERYPEVSIYNRLCDMEWNTPIGEAEACGGDALVRVAAFRQVNGYRDSLIAGEEPEMCLRLRTAGFKVLRIDADMTLHDAAMSQFGQWWKRNVRAGHAFAEVSWIHRAAPIRMWQRECRSNWLWALALPLAALLLAPFTHGLSLLAFLVYIYLGVRIYRWRRRQGDIPDDALRYAAFCVLGKFPQMLGQCQYHKNRLLSRQSALIEYKGAVAADPGGPLKIGYLVNQYPHVSHSFIRREIVALEAQGLKIERFSVRPSSEEMVDPGDRAEQQRTQVILHVGAVGLIGAVVSKFFHHPAVLFKALWLALRVGFRSDRGVLRHMIYLAEACVLLDRLRECGVCHLHAHFGTNSATVALLTRMLGGPPYSFTVHGPEEFDHPEELSLGRKIEHAAMVVAISDFGKSQLFRWCSYAHWPKVQVVHCGVDAGFLAAGPQPVPDTTRLVCVGRLSEQKGQLLILQALRQVMMEGIGFEMVLAGDGPMRPIIEEQIRSLGLTGQVRITGWLSNEAVRNEILSARAMVLPSFAEGLPVVLMEALALGRPVVTTYVAGIPELVQNGVNGFLVPAGSVPALVAALREALKTPVERLSEMGKVGAERAAAMHNITTEAAKLAALFRGLHPTAQPPVVEPEKEPAKALVETGG